jgi:type III secretory pathway component EscV
MIKEELRRQADASIRMHIALWGSVWLAPLLIVQFGVPHGLGMLSTMVLAVFLYFFHPYRRIRTRIQNRRDNNRNYQQFLSMKTEGKEHAPTTDTNHTHSND